MPVLANGVSWWASFPWAAVGAVGAAIGLILGAFKLVRDLSMAWGAERQKNLEQDRRFEEHDERIRALEKVASGVPEEVEEQMSVQTQAAKSADAQLRHNVALHARKIQRLEIRQAAARARCDALHGPPSQVVDLEDSEETVLLDETERKEDDAA